MLGVKILKISNQFDWLTKQHRILTDPDLSSHTKRRTKIMNKFLFIKDYKVRILCALS